MRAVVTGGAGFIGQPLVRGLLDTGWDVLDIDLADGIDIATDDLSAITRFGPEVLFHLAAQVSVPQSFADPLRDLAVNVAGTHRVIAAARCRIVFMSSGGAVYGETGDAATEETPPAPLSYYGVHKLAAEGHVRLAGLPAVIVRPSNVYGPGQRAGADGGVVAAFAQQARRGVLTIHGDGQQVRDFVHVADVVAALMLLWDHEGTWNVSTGEGTTILELARLVDGGAEVELQPARPGDVRRSVLSSARLRGLGWVPERTLASHLTAAVL